MIFKSTKTRAKQILEHLNKMYEPGNQKKSKLNIWRLYLYPAYGISYRTLMRYASIIREENKKQSV